VNDDEEERTHNLMTLVEKYISHSLFLSFNNTTRQVVSKASKADDVFLFYHISIVGVFQLFF
jgi:hypothetical protein